MVIISFYDVFKQGEIKYWEFEAIMREFEEKGLLSTVSCNGEYCNTACRTWKLYDVFNHGGFLGMDDILRSNILKLNFEISILEKELGYMKLDRFQKIAEIASSIVGFLDRIM